MKKLSSLVAILAIVFAIGSAFTSVQNDNAFERWEILYAVGYSGSQEPADVDAAQLTKLEQNLSSEPQESYIRETFCPVETPICVIVLKFLDDQPDAVTVYFGTFIG